MWGGGKETSNGEGEYMNISPPLNDLPPSMKHTLTTFCSSFRILDHDAHRCFDQKRWSLLTDSAEVIRRPRLYGQTTR